MFPFVAGVRTVKKRPYVYCAIAGTSGSSVIATSQLIRWKSADCKVLISKPIHFQAAGEMRHGEPD